MNFLGIQYDTVCTLILINMELFWKYGMCLCSGIVSMLCIGMCVNTLKYVYWIVLYSILSIM